MSVIAGVYYTDGKPADEGRLRRILQAYSEHGPDGMGTWCSGSVALGHLMRFNTPESRQEKLPGAWPDAGLAITASARIDNREELFDELDVPSGERIGMPDSLLILGAYRKWGGDCPAKLEGDFAFAIHDQRVGELFCVRSCFPLTKRLYYVHTNQCFAFGSLIRPLLSISGLPKRLNVEALANLVSYSMLRASADPALVREPLFAGVKEVPPASVIRVRPDGSIQLRQYWRPSPHHTIRLGSHEEYYEGVRDLLIRAVHDRLRSVAPVASFLSGGLDSSSIVCIAARQLQVTGKRLATLSSALPEGHPGPEEDERRFIEVVRAAEDIDHSYVFPTQGLLDETVGHLDYMEHPGSSEKQYVYDALFEEAASRSVGVILDGLGGEFGPSNKAVGLFPHLARRGEWRHLGRELRGLAEHSEQPLPGVFLREIVVPWLPWLGKAYRWAKGGFRPQSVRLPLSTEFVRHYRINRRFNPRQNPTIPHWNPKQALCRGIQFFNRQHSSQAMASGIGERYPFLDRRLIDFCLAVPERLYCEKGWKRNLIRRSMEGILPRPIQWRKTKGPFSPDYYRRFLLARPAIRAQLASIPPGDRIRDYFDVNAILDAMESLGETIHAETSLEGLAAKTCIQLPLKYIRFLRWFDQVQV